MLNACCIQAVDVVKDAPRKIGFLKKGGGGGRGAKTLDFGAAGPGAEGGGGTHQTGEGSRGQGGSPRRGCGGEDSGLGTLQPLLKQNILCVNLASMFRSIGFSHRGGDTGAAHLHPTIIRTSCGMPYFIM